MSSTRSDELNIPLCVFTLSLAGSSLGYVSPRLGSSLRLAVARVELFDVPHAGSALQLVESQRLFNLLQLEVLHDCHCRLLFVSIVVNLKDFAIMCYMCVLHTHTKAMVKVSLPVTGPALQQ